MTSGSNETRILIGLEVFECMANMEDFSHGDHGVCALSNRPLGNIASMNTSAQLIGTKLRHAREFKNYSQEYMTESLGVSQSTFGRREKGKVLPKLDVLEKAAEILGSPAQALFSPEPFILPQHNNTGGSGHIVNQHDHVPG